MRERQLAFAAAIESLEDRTLLVAPLMDIDLDGQAEPLSDGILLLRYFAGFEGTTLTNGVVNPAGQRTDPAAIKTFLDSVKPEFDIDGDGTSEPLSDGILVLRFLAGFRGDALIQGVVNPDGLRTSAAAIEQYLIDRRDGSNTAPELGALTNPTVAEGTLLEVTVTATDVDIPDDTLTFSLADGHPAGMAIDATSGVLTWTPTEADGPGVFDITVRVTDAGGLEDSEPLTVTVSEVNVAPVLTSIAPQTVDEGSPLSFTATAADPDLPANTLTFSLDAGAPTGATIDPATGAFSWTPSEADGPGTANVTIRVTDAGGLADFETVAVTIGEVNAAPVLVPIGTKNVDEEFPLTFTATATDADLPANALTFSLDAGAPTGAAINPSTGVFSWTPGEADGPGPFTVTVRVTDAGGLDDSETITITVGEVNTAPVLTAIGPKSIAEGSPLTFSATATDADQPNNSLSFSLDAGAPTGATINPTTGAFSWTPAETDGPGSFDITVRVADNAGLEDSETVTITVTEVNVAPELAAIGAKTVDEGITLQFTAAATDADRPANTLTYSLDAGAPTGATIDPTSGAFSWTPTEANGPGSFDITVRVTDGSGLDDAETLTVTVDEVNGAPVLTVIGAKAIDEGTLLAFTAAATDADLPAGALTWSLDAGAPTGAAIDPASGAFSWTPGEAEGPGSFDITVRVTDAGGLDDSETVTVTVNEVNVAPVLTAIGAKAIDEGTLLAFTAAATDADLPAGTLTWSLDAGAPGGAAIDAASGAFSWTPGEADGPGPFDITVRVTDGGGLDDAETLTVTVNEVNVAPVLNPIGDKPVNEQTLLQFSVVATDADLPANTLTYSLDAGAPGGAAIDPTTGAFTWTPTEADGPGTFEITVRATDAGGLDDSETITVTVAEVNTAPVLDAIADQFARRGQPVQFTATATDIDAPANSLTYSFDGGAPTGATIDLNTGQFTWTSTAANPAGLITVPVKVTDSGGLTDVKNVSVRVYSNTMEQFAAGAVNFLRTTVDPNSGLPRNEATQSELDTATFDTNSDFFNPAQLGNLLTVVTLAHALREQTSGGFNEGFSDAELLSYLDNAADSLETMLLNDAYGSGNSKALFQSYNTADGTFLDNAEVASIDHSQLLAGLEATENYLRSLNAASFDAGVNAADVTALADQLAQLSSQFDLSLWFDGTNVRQGAPNNPTGGGILDRIHSESRFVPLAGFARGELTEAQFTNVIEFMVASSAADAGNGIAQLPFFGTALESWAVTPYISSELTTDFGTDSLLPLADAQIATATGLGLPAAGATGIATGLTSGSVFRAFGLSPSEGSHPDRDIALLVPPAAGMMAGALAGANAAAVTNLDNVATSLEAAGLLDPVFGVPNYQSIIGVTPDGIVDPARNVRGTLELQQMGVGLLNALLGGSFLETQLRADAGWDAAITAYVGLLTEPPPAAITSISPANGEELVSTTRESIVRFNEPVDPATVDPDSFYAIANGGRLPGRIVVSSTGLFATIFYDEPLPASTEVRVTVDGNAILSATGIALDGNGDGEPGGVAVADFTTLPVTRISGTDVWGYVYESNRTNPDGSDIPVVGARIELDAFPGVYAETDATGYFILEDMPAPEFFVHVNGTSADAGAGYYYPNVGKPFHSIPGESIQLQVHDDPFNIYLPRFANDDFTSITPGQETVIGFGDQAKQDLLELFPEVDPTAWDRLELSLPADAAFFNDGTPATQIQISPVAPDRIPAPLPPGVSPTLVWSVQAGGATNFDAPAPITYPNIYGLQPGEKRLIFSFDHDAGKWITIGTGTVSADGLAIESDEGVGIRAPGWGFIPPDPSTRNDNIVNPGVPRPPDRDNDGDPDVTDDDDDNDGIPDEDDEDFEWQITVGIQGQSVFTPLEVGVSAGLTVPASVFDEPDSVTVGYSEEWFPFGQKSSEPFAFEFSFTVGEFWADLIPEFSIPIPSFEASIELSAAFGLAGEIDVTGGEPELEFENVEIRPGNVQIDFEVKINEPFLCRLPFDIGETICSPLAVSVPLIGPPSIPLPDVDIPLPFLPVVDFNDEFFAGLMASASVSGGINDTRVSLRKERVPVSSALLVSPTGIESLPAGDDPLVPLSSHFTGPVPGFSDSPSINDDPNVYYLFEMENGVAVRGKVAPGEPMDAILPANMPYMLSLFYPQGNQTTVYGGETGAPGTICPDPIPMTQIGGFDADGDGLSDLAEKVIGTSLTLSDTDMDGISDLAEIEQGLDPLDDRGFPTGVISSLPLRGEAVEVAVEGSVFEATSQTAYVATGAYGLAVVDASRFNNPIVLGQLDLPGDNTDVVVNATRTRAFLAAGGPGIHVVDVSDSMLPTLVRTIPVAAGANHVVRYDGLLYAAGRQSNRLTVIDPISGEILQIVPLGGNVTDLARAGNTVYATTHNNKLLIVDISGFDAAVAGSVDLPSSAAAVFVEGGIAYVSNGGNGYSTVDVTDPANPTVISGPDTPAVQASNRKTLTNGSGLGIIVAGSRGIELHDASDPLTTYSFLTRIDTPGFAASASIAAGIAFVADGTAGLQVVNYLSFDSQGQAPTVAIAADVTDVDGATAGIQVVEGTSIPISVTVADDVQLRNVQLLVNNRVVRNDVSVPFDLVAIAPSITASLDTMTIAVRATDTGGNSTTSDVITLSLVEDTVAPEIVGTTPVADDEVFFTPSIDLRFSEALDEAAINTTGLSLIFLGLDGVAGGGDDVPVDIDNVELRALSRRLSIFPDGILDTGNYQLTVDPAVISDRAGNLLAAPFILPFTIRPASNIHAEHGTPTVFRAPAANAGQTIDFLVPWQPDQTEVRFTTADSSGNLGTRDVSPVDSVVSGAVRQVFVDVPIEATTGDLLIYGTPDSDYQLFSNWTVGDGTVDLIGEDSGGGTFFDFLPGNGLYVDLDGSTSDAGLLESRTLTLEPGDYELTFDLAGNQWSGSDTVNLSVGNSTVNLLTAQDIRDFDDPFSTATHTFNVAATTTAAIVFDHLGGDNRGLLLDNVRLTNTTSGAVLLQDDFNMTFPGGPLPLQIVPTLTDVDQGAGDVYHDGGIRLTGTGFFEGDMTINFGDVSVIDSSTSSSPVDTSNSNTYLDLTVPTDASPGPIYVTTAGGTSEPFALSFSQLNAVADSGTPADASLPSANPGQAIVFFGEGFDDSTDFVFRWVEINGDESERVVRPLAVSADRASAVVVVPTDAITGSVFVAGDRNATEALLQVVPVITDVDWTSVASDGTTMDVRLWGRGFVEAHDSVYQFGTSTPLVDDDVSSSPIDVSWSSFRNDTVFLDNVPLSDEFHGGVTVTTAGGTSAPFVRSFTDVIAVAQSGTPANAAEASANPDQYVTLAGESLTRTTDILASYIYYDGTQYWQLLQPDYVNADGTLASFTVPDYFAGADVVRLPGSDAAPVLQIVPEVDSVDVYTTSSRVRLRGRGFVEGNNSVYTFAGQSLTDDDIASSPIDVSYSFVHSADSVNLTLPLHGFGTGTVTTIGGTSAPFDSGETFNFLNPGFGKLNDVTVEPASGDLFVASDNAIHRIDPATGAEISSIATGISWGGLQWLTTSMPQLGGIPNIPANSLLLFNAATSRVEAVNPADGSLLAQVSVSGGIVAGLYHSGRDSLFLLDYTTSEVIEVSPVDASEINRFATTIPISNGGLTLDPVTGNLWIGSDNSTLIAEVAVDGTPVRTIDLSAHSITSEISGLAFDASGQLLVSSTRGVVYRIDPNSPPPAAPVLASIASTATDGTAANGAVASANVNQTITLIGTGFTRQTQVVVPTRDNDGADGETTLNGIPNAAGTSLEIRIPDTATTGSVQLVGGTGSANLQIVPVITNVSGSPSAGGFSLFGSGFMEGASVISVNGDGIDDRDTNMPDTNVTGTRNDRYDLVAQFSTDGPITVTTAGGSSTHTGPAFASPAFVEFTGITASAARGTATMSSNASANTGQTITLIGRGFTNSTVVVFDGVSESGQVGSLARTGMESNGGRVLTVTIPIQAQTGTVRVIGSGAAIPLQIVPVLNSVGGTIAAGNTIVLDGSGLVQGDLSFTIDGQPAAVVSQSNLLDRVNLTGGGETDQQIVTLTVPAGTTDGVIQVSTSGGTFTLQSGVILAVLPDITTSGDIGDTLATALPVALPADSIVTIDPTIGDNASGVRDVDLFRFVLNGGDDVRIDVLASGSGDGTLGDSYLRVFDAAGTELIWNDSSGAWPDSRIQWTVPNNGDYFIGVSGDANRSYDPAIAGSGNTDGSTGTYLLRVERLAAGSSTISDIVTTLDSGTARIAGVSSTNVRDAAGNPAVITLIGNGFEATDRVVFRMTDSAGNASDQTVTPLTIATDGTSLTAEVPDAAVSGIVRLERESAGRFLQIVPTLSDVDQGSGDRFHDGSLTLRGSGFIEGDVEIHFGSESQRDRTTSSSPINAVWSWLPNDSIGLTVASNVPVGPISVSTIGGTSAPFGMTFTGITSVASSGTPANPVLASANPGQAITLNGSGFDDTTDVLFRWVETNGLEYELIVRPFAVANDGTSAVVIVPNEAITASISVIGDLNATAPVLQIVPVISNVDFTSVSGDGSSLSVRLHGRGFVEGHDSEYAFGSQTPIVDDSNSSSPIDVSWSSIRNDHVNLSGIPLTPDFHGAITVTTAGGTSAPFSRTFADLIGVAMSGTPANAAEASVNPGQTVRLIGTKLSEQMDILSQYVYYDGTTYFELIQPQWVNVAGTEATYIVPDHFNGAFTVQVPGTATGHVLQVVPEIDSAWIDSSNGRLRINGRGFLEGNDSTYTIAGVTLTDTDLSSSPIDVSYSVSHSGDSVYFNLPMHGFGTLSVSTTGGTSPSFGANQPLEFLNPDLDGLYDVAWMPGGSADGTIILHSGTQIHRIDPATGISLGSFALSNGINSSGVGLDYVANAITVNGTAVPAGSLLLTDHWDSPTDTLVAVDPVTGTLHATLDFGENFDPVGVAYHAARGTIFVLDENPDEIREVSLADASVLNTFATPFAVSSGDIAVHPVTGNLWLMSNQSDRLAEIAPDGTVLQSIHVTAWHLENQITGLAFDNAGRLLLSSLRDVVYRLDLSGQPPAQPTITSMATVATDGTPASGGEASANLRQTIEIVGTNLSRETRVIFPTIDANGVEGFASVTGVASADGNRLSVIVPDLATTGDVRVNGPGRVNIGFNSSADAIYRDIALPFTAAGTSASIDFFGDDLEAFDNESWGIDNVRVVRVSDSSIIYSTDFEAGIGGEWSDSRLASTGQFTQFSGRFSNDTQTLSVSGLTDGDAYRVEFDFYAIDTWDGDRSPQEYFRVVIDGRAAFNHTFSNRPDASQSYIDPASGSVLLQVVPVITGTSGGPGDAVFDIFGTGFVEGGTTVTSGSVLVSDLEKNQTGFNVFGSRNDRIDDVWLPFAVDGPLTVSTAGGSFTVGGTLFATPAFVELNSFEAVAVAGIPGNSAQPSANTQQSITLHGRGFTTSTVVQFDAVDENGSAGVISVTGTAANGGRTLTVTVPLLAATGNLRVVGDATELPLQIVPVLRSVGGTLIDGNTLAVTGAGLVAGDVSFTIDGQPAAIQSIANVLWSGFDQQIGRLTVPAGTSDGVITATTAGGTFTLQTGAVPNALPDVPTTLDVPDTIATAIPVNVTANSIVTVNSIVGNNASGNGDVDLFAVTLVRNDVLRIDVLGSGDGSGTLSNAYLRIFDSSSNELASNYFSGPGGDPYLRVIVPTTGTWYIGVSGYANDTYDPLMADSGSGGSTGTYGLRIERMAEGTSAISGITATAGSGTPALTGIASANIGETITLTGNGFVTGDRVVFRYVDSNGNIGTWTVNPSSIAADGTSLEVDVPSQAVTGVVRIERETVGRYLQIVPTLTDVDQGNNDSFHGGSLAIDGSGFIEHASIVHFGATELSDAANTWHLNVTGSSVANGRIFLTVPNDVPSGPIRVSTVGGTSDPFGLTFTDITATASSGTPADSGEASANPGQTITLTGSGFDDTTDVVFRWVETDGQEYQRVVRPETVAVDGTSLTIVVPIDAITGPVMIAGDAGANAPLLQIVPVVTSVDVISGSARVRVSGGGFIEGHNSVYTFAGSRLIDWSISSQPTDVTWITNRNAEVNLTMPVSGFGPFTVRTTGGTSAPFDLNVLNPGESALWDLAFNPANSEILVANDSEVVRINSSTGATTGRFSLPDGYAQLYSGLHIVAAPVSLGGTAVAAGSLLIFDGYTSNDKVFAVSPIDGTLIATLDLGADYDVVGGVFDPVSGNLFLLDGSPDEIHEINPGDGTLIGSFAIPINVSSGDVTLDPVTGNLWIASDQTTDIVEMTTAGVEVRRVDLTAQGPGNELSGLDFDDSGNLLASSDFGVVYRIDVNAGPLMSVQPAAGSSLAGAAVPDADAVAAIVTEAVTRWNSSGVTTFDPSTDASPLEVRFADLPVGYLGLFTAGVITLDTNADGHGWFVDPTPDRDEEFGADRFDLLQARDDRATGRIDLLTALMHEIGHAAGLEDESDESDTHNPMHHQLAPGLRRVGSSQNSARRDRDDRDLDHTDLLFVDTRLLHDALDAI